MASLDSPALIGSLVFGCLCILVQAARLLQRAWTSPLNTVANAHWTVQWTGAWIWWKRVQEVDTPAIHDAHQRLGPVVRIGPDELSIVDVDGGLKPIYEGRMPKTNWYDLGRSYGQEPLFAIRDEGPHRHHKKLTAKPYTKTYMTASKAWLAEQTELASRLVKGLEEEIKTRSVVEMYDVFFAWGADANASYLFGGSNTLNLLHDFAKAGQMRDAYGAQRLYQFIGIHLPIPTQVFSWLGYHPEIAWMREMQDKAERARTSDPQSRRDSVYEYMRENLLALRPKQDADNTHLSATEIAVLSAEMQDQMVAGVDTSAGVLTTCAWLLSLDENLYWQRSVREEVNSCSGEVALAALPTVDAVIKETLRLFGTLAGGPPRVTDRIAALGPPGHQVTVPPGVTVHCPAYTIHRNAIFSDADEFHPERWLDSSPTTLKEMHRWFWAFSSGSRRCLGENLAMSNMRVAIAAVWGTFETRVTDKTHFTLSQGLLMIPLPNKEGEYLRLAIRKAAGRG